MTNILRALVKYIAFGLIVLGLLLSPFGGSIPRAGACSFEVSPSGTITLGPGMTTQWITVSTQSTCHWSIDASGTVVRNFQWLFIGFGRKGSATIGFDVLPNTDSRPRTAILTIADVPIKVTQLDGMLRGNLSVSPTLIKPGQSATLSWTTTNAQSVRIDPAPGNVSENGTITISPTAPTNYTLTAIKAGGERVTSTVTIDVRACMYTVTPATSTPGPHAGTIDFAIVASQPTCAWSTTSDQSWITPHNGVGSGTFGFAIAENETNAARTANLTVAHTPITITQSAPPLIYGLSRAQAEQLYEALKNVPARLLPQVNASYPSSTFGLPRVDKEFMRPGLTPECIGSALGPDLSRFISHDQLGQALGKPIAYKDSPPTSAKDIFKYGVTRAELESIYQSLKNGEQKPLVTAGATGVYPMGWNEQFTPLARLACNGMVRINTGTDFTDYGLFKRAWTTAEAAARGYKDIAPNEYRRVSQIPYRFLAPGYVAGIAAASALGVAGTPRTVVFSASELFSAVPFTTLETDLGHAPSGATTPELYDDTMYIRLASDEIKSSELQRSNQETMPADTSTASTSDPTTPSEETSASPQSPAAPSTPAEPTIAPFAKWSADHPIEYSEDAARALLSAQPKYADVILYFDDYTTKIIGSTLREKCRYDGSTLANKKDCAAAVTLGVLYGGWIQSDIEELGDDLYLLYTGRRPDGTVVTSDSEFYGSAFRVIFNPLSRAVDVIKSGTKALFKATDFWGEWLQTLLETSSAGNQLEK